jgi:hypothetical protein
MPYSLLADLLVLVHLLIVCFVVGGQVAITVGAFRRWAWIRNPVFRIVHAALIAFIAVNALSGVLCPLTDWEYALRVRAGQAVQADISFVGRLVRAVLYYELPPRVFATAYALFALLVIATFIVVPPRWRRPAAGD